MDARGESSTLSLRVQRKRDVAHARDTFDYFSTAGVTPQGAFRGQQAKLNMHLPLQRSRPRPYSELDAWVGRLCAHPRPQH